MFTVLSKITFIQQPSASFPARNKTIVYNFCHEYKCSSSWRDLTDDGEITLPKNVYYLDENGNKVSASGTNVNIGGFGSTTPLFLCGDKVIMEWGYAYYDKTGNEVAPMAEIFRGYISQVTSKKPFVLKVQDNMYILKKHQAQGGNNNFFAGGKYTAESMLQEMINNAGLSFTVNTTTETNIGDFRVQSLTIAQVLEELQRLYHFEAYFKGDELRIGSWIYLDSDAGNPPYWKFKFQNNILSDPEPDLEYRRKDDIILSAVAKNTIEENTGKTTRDGQMKTKRVKLEVLVTFENGSDTPKYFVASKDNPIPANEGGERRTFFFLGAKTVEDLEQMATDQLKKYYYTGFKGKFTTFGMPLIEFGNNIDLIDDLLPERNGRYKVKSVERTGGVGGLRQTIELDYLIMRLDAAGKPIL
jgi:hypothetical protein